MSVNGKILTLLINHFKVQDGTQPSVAKRTRQAERVAELVKLAVKDGRLPIVLGDLNVPPKSDTSLNALLKNSLLKDPFSLDAWTHYYVPYKKVSRLDYILPHNSLDVISTDIVRKGLTTKCKQYTGPRYPTVAQEHTEASDHCTISALLEV